MSGSAVDSPRHASATPEGAAAYVPATHQPHGAAQRGGCRGCGLWERATQAVFGEGSAHRPLALVGEQPGDREDIAGRPFVGPAGRVFGEALDEAGIDPSLVYTTNAVKHFSWTPRGKRRIHKRPTDREVAACRPWPVAELAAVKPVIVVALGAVAAAALLGPDVPRGHALGGCAPCVISARARARTAVGCDSRTSPCTSRI